MSTLEDLLIRIGADTSDAEKGIGGLQGLLDSKLARIGAASAAAGGALEAFARGQADSNAQTRQLAAALGISEDAMRTMATQTANVGFPLGEVLDLMETGKQLGLRSSAELRDYATFWDMVGDATGESATELGKAGTALGVVGIKAGEEAKALGALGFVQEHTTQGVGEFLTFLGRVGPDLAEMGLGVDETAALLGAMEQELGLTGRAARTQLNEALSESDGTFSGLIDTLGITETTLDGYMSKVEESSGVLERNADIVDQTFTPLQKVQNKVQELMFRYGGLAEAAGTLAMPLMALGPALGAAKWAAQTAGMLGYKAAALAVRTATAIWTGVQWLLNVALTANPIGLIIVAIAALIAIIVLIATKTTWFQTIWKHVWGGIKTVALAVGRWFRDTLWNKWILGAFNAITRGAGLLWSYFQSLPGKLRGMFFKVVNFITAPFRMAFNAVASMWNNTVGRLTWTVPSWIPFIGGKSLSAPKLPMLPAFHTGGIFAGPGEGPAMVRAGEGVFTPEQMRALAPVGASVLELRSSGNRVDDFLLELLRLAIRKRGGDPVKVLTPKGSRA